MALSRIIEVYRLLGMERYERAFHTPLLAELLSPLGSHGQGRLFLESFLAELCAMIADECKDSNWYVLPEKEYIDLRIANEIRIFIENKVDTDAHSGQLSRYFKVWDERYGQRGCFAYLTIEGDDPPDAGFDESMGFSRASIEKKLKLWSYKKNIVPWLDSVIDKIEAPVVKHMVIQYVDVLRNL